jgi:hypothetical protein
MKRKTLAALLAFVMAFTMGCGVIESLIGGGSGAGTVANLWPDVPALDGATKADLQLPAAAKLFIQAAFQGRLEFIAYTTAKTPQEAQAFYTNERMQAAGWNAEAGGCANAPATTADAAFCMFGKKEDSKETGLILFMTPDEEKKNTQVFYVRVDVTSTPTP